MSVGRSSARSATKSAAPKIVRTRLGHRGGRVGVTARTASPGPGSSASGGETRSATPSAEVTATWSRTNSSVASHAATKIALWEGNMVSNNII